MCSAVAVLDDGLGDGGDVVVVEGGGEGAAAMAGGPEGDALSGDLPGRDGGRSRR